jgi:hypothetical protein
MPLTQRSKAFVTRITGAAFLLIALGFYTSAEDRSILGRWSPSFVAAWLGLAVLLSIYAGWALRSRPSGSVSQGLALGDWTFLIWSLAYLCAALEDPVQAGRLFEANVVGSSTWLSAALEWIVLVLLLGSAAVAARRLSPRLRDVALLVGSMAATGIALEGIARVVAFAAPAPQGFPTYRSNIWGRRFVRLNRDGFRDVDPPAAEPDGTRRIAVIGDSYAFGWGIPDINDRVGEQVAGRLTRETGQPWRSINASQGDRNTLTEFPFMDYVLRFHPDVLVLLYVFNDIDYLRRVTARGPLTDPGSMLGRLHPLRVLFVNSYLVQEIYIRVRHLPFMTHSSGGVEDPYRDPELVTRHLADVARLMGEAREVPLPILVPFDIAPGTDSALRERYDHFVCRLLAAGQPAVSVREAFVGHELSQLTVNPFDAHPNGLANQLLADQLAPLILGGLRDRRSVAAESLRSRVTCGETSAGAE